MAGPRKGTGKHKPSTKSIRYTGRTKVGKKWEVAKDFIYYTTAMTWADKYPKSRALFVGMNMYYRDGMLEEHRRNAAVALSYKRGIKHAAEKYGMSEMTIRRLRGQK